MKNQQKTTMQWLVMWLTGITIEKKTNLPDSFYTCKATGWQYAPTGDWYSMTVYINKAPNLAHRFMQRLLFGVKYRMNKEI